MLPLPLAPDPSADKSVARMSRYAFELLRSLDTFAFLLFEELIRPYYDI